MIAFIGKAQKCTSICASGTNEHIKCDRNTHHRKIGMNNQLFIYYLYDYPYKQCKTDIIT